MTFGEGSEVDQIIFGDDLAYQEAFFIFCSQINIVELSYPPVDIRDDKYLYPQLGRASVMGTIGHEGPRLHMAVVGPVGTS